MFICRNKTKTISAILLVVVSTAAAGVGAYLYLLYLNSLTSYNLNGGEYLPEFYIDFSSFSQNVQYSAIACGAVFVFSLITAMCKRPFFSFLFIIIAMAAGVYTI
jgi:hypothetical protein